MKIDRMIGILSILLQKEKVTAPYLAEKFEVSRRTINRDIEALCMAGIPLVTETGANGGISIIENYKIDRALLTTSDMQAILAGLRSLDSVSGTNRYAQLMEKLSVGASNLLPEIHIFSSILPPGIPNLPYPPKWNCCTTSSSQATRFPLLIILQTRRRNERLNPTI